MTPTKPPLQDDAYDDGIRDAGDHDLLHNDEVAHEHKDINIRTVLIAALVLAIVVAVSAAAMAGLFTLLEHQAAASDPQLSPLAVPTGQLPPQPRIEWNLDERGGLRKAREAEAKTLENYGWIDQKTGVAHMPIDEAKKLLLQRGLPSRQGGGTPPEGTNAPASGEANGGRAIGRPPVTR